MAQKPEMAENKEGDDNKMDMTNIDVYLTLDGKKLKTTNHILLKAWNASEIVLEATNLFIDCIFKITQRRFHPIPESNWLRNEKVHSKKSNDGSRCRVPIIIGISEQMFERLSFKYDKDKQENIVTKIKYESQVFIPGVDENAIKLIDNALIIAANDNNIKEFVTEINNKIEKQFEIAKKSIDKDTTEIALSIEECLNLEI